MAGDDDAHDPEDPEPEPQPEPERDVVADADAMADALEDELADAVHEPERSLPIALTVPAVVLTAAMFLPLHPDGYSFAQILYVAFLRSPLEGLITLLGFGAPFCFGMIVAALAGLGPRVTQRIGERALVVNLSLLHAQLVLVAALLWSGDQGMMPLALLGFAIVSGGYFIVYHARAAASGIDGQPGSGGPTQRWLVRWGATVIVAICGWIRLQLLIGVRLGWAIEVVLGTCVAMAVLLMRRRE